MRNKQKGDLSVQPVKTAQSVKGNSPVRYSWHNYRSYSPFSA